LLRADANKIHCSRANSFTVDDLVKEANEGVFDVRRCGGRFGCEIVRDIIEGEITRSEFEGLVNDVANELGLQSVPRKRRTAAGEFWKALAKN